MTVNENFPSSSYTQKSLDQIHENVQELPEESKNKIKCFFKRFSLKKNEREDEEGEMMSEQVDVIGVVGEDFIALFPRCICLLLLASIVYRGLE